MKLQILFNILGFISFFICIWLGAPLVHINGSYPFESIFTRIIIILCFIFIFILLLIFYLFWKGYTNNKLTEALYTHFFSKNLNNPSLIKKKIQKAFKLLKKAARRGGETPYQLRTIPCFLVIGHSGSGRETVIRESGFHFPDLNSLNPIKLEGSVEIKGNQWWFAEEGILFTIPLEEKNREEWGAALKVLKKHRRAKPIHAVIVTCPIIDFVSRKEDEKETYATQLKECLYNIYKHLQVSFPVYFMVTKCDQLSGFQEFFHDLPIKEREQIWGINFNVEKDEVNYSEDFLNQFQLLSLRLTQLLPWKLSRSQSQEEKDRIYLFPQQLQFMVSSILALFKDIFTRAAEDEQYFLQGIYFSSGRQEGKSLDFLAAGNMGRVGGELPYWHFQQDQKWGLFLKEAFSYIHSVSQNFVKFAPRRALFYRWSKVILCTFLFLALVLNSIGLYTQYHFHKARLKQTLCYLNKFKANETIVEYSKHFDDTLIALTPLEEAIRLYEQGINRWVFAFQFYSPYEIKKDLKETLSNFLQSAFLPLIRDHIALLIEKTSPEHESLERLLEIYLQFASPEKMNKALLTEIINLEWKNQYRKAPEKLNQLRHYLKLTLEHPRPLPINLKLVRQTQLKIQREDPVYRVYETLLDYTENRYPFSFTPYPELGEMAFHVFYSSDPKYAIPMIFTLEGFKEIIEQQTPALVKEVAEEDESLGLAVRKDPIYTTQFIERVKDLYGHDYSDQWLKFLNSLKIKEGALLHEQVKILEMLTKKDSPFIKLIKLLGSQTQNASLPNSIKNSFEFINVDLNSELPSLFQNLTNLLTYSRQILHSPEPKKACFEAAKARFSGILKPDPFLELRSSAESLSDPFQEWFIKLEENTWRIIVENAREYIKESLYAQFLQDIRKAFSNKYPFNAEASEDASLAEFTKFFGPKGELTQFFETYIKDFLKTTGTTQWQWKELEGHTLGLNKDIISQLSLGFLIQSSFFKGNSSTPHLEFIVSPELLSENASAVHLKLGPQLITYRHEAPQTYSIQWPFKFENQECKLEFQDFNGKQQSSSYRGEWSLFKWLSKGERLSTSSPSTHFYEWKQGDFKAIFDVSFSDGGDIIDLKKFGEF